MFVHDVIYIFLIFFVLIYNILLSNVQIFYLAPVAGIFTNPNNIFLIFIKFYQ